MRGGGQGQPSTHKHWLRGVEGEKMNKVKLGRTVLQDMSECPCADRMVLFQACVA